MRRLVVMAFFAGLVVGQEARVIVPEIVLEDQFERSQDLKSYRGSVVVLIYGDRQSAKANEQLGEMVHVAFHPEAKGKTPREARRAGVKQVAGVPPEGKHVDVLAVPVACIGKVPGLVARLIRSQIRNGAPEVPVWLDFGDQMKSQFPFKAGVPNVIVIDVRGRYRYAAAGNPTTDGTNRLLGLIEALRKEAAEGK